MNNRIRELAEQAGMGHERWNTTAQFESFLEKFAQLIIQECLSEVTDEVQYQTNYTVADIVSTRVKSHFGVDQ